MYICSANFRLHGSTVELLQKQVYFWKEENPRQLGFEVFTDAVAGSQQEQDISLFFKVSRLDLTSCPLGKECAHPVGKAVKMSQNRIEIYNVWILPPYRDI
jgi:hypothetical protein